MLAKPETSEKGPRRPLGIAHGEAFLHQLPELPTRVELPPFLGFTYTLAERALHLQRTP